MNLIQKSLFALVAITFSAQASDIHERRIAQNLKAIKISDVAEVGTVVKERTQRPFTKFLISVPVKVHTGSACVNFVGFEQNANSKTLELVAKGGYSPVQDACISIYPKPIETVVAFEYQVVAGGFVPADPIQTQYVKFEGAGLYRMTLDMGSNKATFYPMKIR